MSEPRIPIADADAATLRHFAGVTLGLEVNQSMNAVTLRSRIATVAPDLKDIPALPKPAAPIDTGHAAAPDLPPAVEAPVVKAGGVRTLIHYSKDPKVELTVAKTDDPRRPKDVTIAVNGDVWRLQRGKHISLPYRAYIALENAKEKAAVEIDEVNSMGIPIREWQEVYSYPFTVHKMPSDEEIAAWRAATDDAVASPHGRKAA